MSVCNDNMWGYSTSIITQDKVRWIEMAAVLPFWTAMIVYYVEGDYGHLMNGKVGQQQFRTAVRGHCFSFLVPWEDILESLNRSMSDTDMQSIPREEECLKYLLWCI